VPVPVVDALEIVHIHQDDHEAPVLQPLDLAFIGFAVVELCQRVQRVG